MQDKIPMTFKYWKFLKINSLTWRVTNRQTIDTLLCTRQKGGLHTSSVVVQQVSQRVVLDHGGYVSQKDFGFWIPHRYTHFLNCYSRKYFFTVYFLHTQNVVTVEQSKFELSSVHVSPKKRNMFHLSSLYVNFLICSKGIRNVVLSCANTTARINNIFFPLETPCGCSLIKVEIDPGWGFHFSFRRRWHCTACQPQAGLHINLYTFAHLASKKY